jgi:predicted nucleic acid-binding protein
VPVRRSRRIALSVDRGLAYADSSALVKLVIDEPESDALERHLVDGPVLATSRIALVEVSRATALANPAPEVAEETMLLLESCILVDVTDPLLRAAARLSSRSVRTLDALHLASALRIEADELLAYDQRLVAAATERGLAVTSPGATSSGT